MRYHRDKASTFRPTSGSNIEALEFIDVQLIFCHSCSPEQDLKEENPEVIRKFSLSFKKQASAHFLHEVYLLILIIIIELYLTRVKHIDYWSASSFHNGPPTIKVIKHIN